MNFYATEPEAQLHNSHVRRQAYTLVRESIKVQPAKYRSQAKWSSGAHWIQISINNNRNIITPTVCVCVSVCPSKATFLFLSRWPRSQFWFEPRWLATQFNLSKWPFRPFDRETRGPYRHMKRSSPSKASLVWSRVTDDYACNLENI